jgi:hypothetical protein
MEGGGQGGQPEQSIGSNEQRIRPLIPPNQARFSNLLYYFYNIHDTTYQPIFLSGSYGRRMIPCLSVRGKFPVHQQEDRPPLPHRHRQRYGAQVLLHEVIDRKINLHLTQLVSELNTTAQVSKEDFKEDHNKDQLPLTVVARIRSPKEYL